MSAFPGVSSYQSSSLGSKFVVIGVAYCQEMRRNALFHKVLPVLTKYLVNNYCLLIGGGDMQSVPLYIRLVFKARNSNFIDDREYIDIRTESIENFINSQK